MIYIGEGEMRVSARKDKKPLVLLALSLNVSHPCVAFGPRTAVGWPAKLLLLLPKFFFIRHLLAGTKELQVHHCRHLPGLNQGQHQLAYGPGKTQTGCNQICDLANAERM